MGEIIIHIFKDGKETGEIICASKDSRLDQALRGIRQKYDFLFDEQELIDLDLKFISNQPSYQFDGLGLQFILNLKDDQRQDQQQQDIIDFQQNLQVQFSEWSNIEDNLNLNDRIIQFNNIVLFLNPNGQQIKFYFFEPFQSEGILEMKDGQFQNNYEGEKFQILFQYQIYCLEQGFVIKWQNNKYGQVIFK